MQLPPGPNAPSPLLLARWIWSPLPFLDECARRYGDYFTVHLPGMPPNVVFSDPQAVKDLFTADPDDVRLGEISRVLRPVMGENSVMLVDGARHLRQRKLMLPPFHGDRMRAYGKVMQETTASAVEKWSLHSSFSMLEEMHGVTLEIILRAIIGVSERGSLEEMRQIVTRFLKVGTSPLATAVFLATPEAYADALIYRVVDPIAVGPWKVNLGPLVPWRNAILAQRRIDEMFYAEFEARRDQASLATRQDVLSLLMSVRDDQGKAMTDPELRDEMVTLLLAGHETTASTLSWAICHLLRNPDKWQKLKDELKGGELEPESVNKNEYLDAVLKETMRLSPVALIVGRRLMAPMRLGKWDLPAGVNALASVYLTQRHTDLWDQPDEFIPERWIGRKNKNDVYQFFPFGGGTRRCIGMAFAYYEMKIILAEIVSRASLRFADARPIKVQRKNITFAPSRGLPVVLENRTL